MDFDPLDRAVVESLLRDHHDAKRSSLLYAFIAMNVGLSKAKCADVITHEQFNEIHEIILELVPLAVCVAYGEEC